MIGQYLSLPVGHADWQEKLKWIFEEDPFTEAWGKGFMPAIEWKGQRPTREIVEELERQGVFWGIHARNDLADVVYTADWNGYCSETELIAKLRPSYVVVHGGLDYLIQNVPYDDPLERYKSPIGAEDYLRACYCQTAMMATMVELMAEFGGDGEVLLENTSITEFVGCQKLPTYCHPRAGNWLDTIKLAKGAGAKPLYDVGHLQYSHNFYARLEDYADLPPAQEFVPAAGPEHIAWDQLGIGIRKGEFPIVRDLLDLPEAIEAIGADYYHLDGGYREEIDGKIATHAPIEYKDERIRDIVAQILRRDDCLICLEVDGSRPDGSGPFPDRQPTEKLQVESWRNLCRIATELT